MFSTKKPFDSKDHSASTNPKLQMYIPERIQKEYAKVAEFLTLPSLLFIGTLFTTKTTKEDKPVPSESLDSLLSSYEHDFGSNISQLIYAIPAKQCWRFFIDDRDQPKGIFTYENEPGYLLAMAKAFDYSFQPIKNLESYIKQLHYLATKEVKGMLFNCDKPSGNLGFRNKWTDLLLSTPINDQEITELLERIKKNNLLTLYIAVPDEPDDPECDTAAPYFFDSSNIEKNTKDTVIFLLKQSHAKASLIEKTPILATNHDDLIAKNKLSYRQSNDISVIFRNSDFDENGISELLKEIKSNPALSLTIETEKSYDPERVIVHGSASINYETINADNVAKYTTQSFINLLKRPSAIVKLHFLHHEEIEKRMQNRIHDYQVDILRANSKLDKLKVIVKFIKDLELLHPFIDGNSRTFLMLRNRLLIDAGLPPVVALNPNKAYTYSVETLLNDTLLAMRNTLNLAKGIEPFSPSTESFLKDLSPEREQYFREVTNVVKILQQQLALEKESRARCMLSQS